MANDKRISALTERTSFSANDYMVLDNAGEGESKKFLASMFTDQFRDMQNILGSKNLLPNKLSTYAENGLTITINADKSITINGTSSADTTVKITQRYNNSGNKMTLQNGDYILSGCTGGNSSSYRMQAIVLKSAAETVLATNYNGDSLFTVNGDDGSASSAQVQISIFVPSGKTLSSKTFYPMVRPASILDNTYIPHAETNAQLTDDVAALNSALTIEDVSNQMTAKSSYVTGLDAFKMGKLLIITFSVSQFVPGTTYFKVPSSLRPKLVNNNGYESVAALTLSSTVDQGKINGINMADGNITGITTQNTTYGGTASFIYLIS